MLGNSNGRVILDFSDKNARHPSDGERFSRLVDLKLRDRASYAVPKLRKLRQNGLERHDGALSPLRGLKVA
ncbi:hypothetical protein [Schleiferilactobacillus harbinensis]|jgi:hypothetical protein|uniref:hypothetical protein n=1 Tax=Schleiferilactobacillus harbinensis TaxID=304207 RepID=UPI0039ED6227